MTGWGHSSNPVRPGAEKTLDYTQVCRSDKGWRFFPLYGCGKNTTAWPIAWTGYVRPATIDQAMGGEFVFSCSNPIPPVAVATSMPAEHVLSRSTGSKESSCITMNIVCHHSPYKTREFSGYRCHSNIPFLSMPGQPVVFTPKSDVCLVCISDNICWVPLLPCD